MIMAKWGGRKDKVIGLSFIEERGNSISEFKGFEEAEKTKSGSISTLFKEPDYRRNIICLILIWSFLGVATYLLSFYTKYM